MPRNHLFRSVARGTCELFLCLEILLLSASAQEDPLFLSGVRYTAGGFAPTYIAVADLNGDRKPDVVAGEYYSGFYLDIGVLLGNGDGTFQSPYKYYSGGGYPMGVAVADVNGDRKPDILVASELSVIGVLLGNGDGTFEAAVTYPCGTNPWSIAVADINGDGKPDAVLGTSIGLSVLLGNGDGTFQLAANYSSLRGFPAWVAVADVNDDGKPDLLAATNTQEIDVLLGKGDGTFAAPSAYPADGLYINSIVVADVNRDGRPDVIVTAPTCTLPNCGNLGAAGIFLGNGDGTFQRVTWYSAGAQGPYAAAIGDVNADEKPDIVVGDGNPPSAGVMLGNGDGTFQAGLPFLSNSYYPTSVAIEDVNEDGRPDILLGVDYAGSGAVSVLLNNTGPHTRTTTSLSSTLNPATVRQAVTYSATVNADSAFPLTGTVLFKDGPTTLAALDLSGNQSTYIATYKTPGTHSITAAYSGDLHNSLSASGAVVETIMGTSRTVITSSLPTSFVGHSVTFTATVTSPYGKISDGEFVTFYDLYVPLGSNTTLNGAATFTTSSLSAGSHVIRATYAGDTTFLSSNGRFIEVVNGYTTSTSLVSSLNPSTYGQTLALTAKVTSAAPVPPTGTVAFAWTSNTGTRTLGTATLDNNGVARLTFAKLNAGSYPVTALYRGDSINVRSSSPLLNQVILEASSTASIGASPNPSVLGQAVTFTATISSPTVTPTGPVTFSKGKTTLGTIQLIGGKATLSSTSLPVGSSTITVTYNGDSNISRSSASVSQTVR